jgi:hypothetical protein
MVPWGQLEFRVERVSPWSVDEVEWSVWVDLERGGDGEGETETDEDEDGDGDVNGHLKVEVKAVLEGAARERVQMRGWMRRPRQTTWRLLQR